MKRICIAVLTCAVISGASIVDAAQHGQVDTALHYRVKGTLIEIREGRGPVSLNPWPAVTYLHNPIDVTCLSSHGCVIVVQFRVRKVEPKNICAYLDGKRMSPGCAAGGDGSDDELLAQKTSTGPHTLQAGVLSGSTGESTAGAWDVVYTLYDDGVH